MDEILHAILGPQPWLTLLAAALEAHLAATAAVLAVLAARLPVRRSMGAGVAYRLWLAPPAAGLIALALFFVRTGPDPLAAGLAAHAPAVKLALAVWALGALALGALFLAAQGRFQAELRAGRAGPAVVGLISPRIVMPRDDGAYTPDELDLIRAHERAHVERKDPRAVAFTALAQCLCWFNPLVHVAAHVLRLDQELACDLSVVLSRPKARGLYARTLLKTQLAATPLPFGCYWPARGKHPLEVRVTLLARGGHARASGGGASVVLASRGAIRP
jgi:beta-lactamase regulating signal transducer with metallopeptidase domain